jgi:magnesium transporter
MNDESKPSPAMLIRCVVYQQGRKVADIEPRQIHEYVAQPDCFVWVALYEPDAATLASMQDEFDLHPLAIEDASHGEQRPKIEEYDDSLFAVVQMLEMDGNELRVGALHMFVGNNYILSVRRGAQKGFQDVRARTEREPELLERGSGYVLYALMDAVVDRYFPVIQAIEAELDRIEEQIFGERLGRENIEQLYSLKQRLVACKHAVGPLLDALTNLSGARVPQFCGGMQEYFRDVSDHLQRLNQSIETIRDTIATAISVNLSMITLQESETMKRLASYAALIALPTLIVGIYGMNFEFMPELHWKHGYEFAWGVMVLVDALAFYLLRRAKWI